MVGEKIVETLQIVVDNINNILEFAFKSFSIYFIVAISILVGLWLTKKIDDKIKYGFWILFTLLVFMSLRFLGFE